MFRYPHPFTIQRPRCCHVTVHDHPSLAVQGPKLDSDEEAAWKRRPRPRRRDSEGRRKEGVAAYPPPARAPVPPPLPARKAMRSSSSLSRRCAPDGIQRELRLRWYGCAGDADRGKDDFRAAARLGGLGGVSGAASSRRPFRPIWPPSRAAGSFPAAARACRRSFRRRRLLAGTWSRCGQSVLGVHWDWVYDYAIRGLIRSERSAIKT